MLSQSNPVHLKKASISMFQVYEKQDLVLIQQKSPTSPLVEKMLFGYDLTM
jgi:hypothetical protein